MFEQTQRYQITLSLPETAPQPGEAAGRILYLYSDNPITTTPIDGNVLAYTAGGALSYTKPDGVFLRKKSVARAMEMITVHLQKAIDITGINYHLAWRDIDGFPTLFLVFGRKSDA